MEHKDFLQALENLKKPIILDGYKIRAPKVRVQKSQQDKALLDNILYSGVWMNKRRKKEDPND